MININFDNPWLLLLAIPLLALVIVPIAIAIKRDNRSKSVVASVILHIVMVLCVSFAFAGTKVTAVVTETNVYVLADVSYSSHANLDTVDSYVKKVKKELPLNSKMGVICFGKDYEINTYLGERFKSVKGSKVDNSATNIASALDYAGTLFEDGVIKRVVLITDGRETNEDTAPLVNAITNLYNAGVKLDVMYLDNNASESVKEVQISGVEYAQSTFSNADANEVSVLVQSSAVSQGSVILYDGETEVKKISKLFEPGYNIVNFDLKEYSGNFADGETKLVKNYRVEVETENGKSDASSFNNEYTFTQTVAKKVRVLLLSDLTMAKEDKEALLNLYGDVAGEVCEKNESQLQTEYYNVIVAEAKANGATSAEIKKNKDLYMAQALEQAQKKLSEVSLFRNIGHLDYQNAVPTSVEELCKFDQIVISNANLTKMRNCSAFLDSLNKVVSNFGKSLITIGDVYIQNDASGDLDILDSMVPVQFGKNDTEKKLVAVVIDVSRSMFQADRLTMAKRATKQFINLLGENDEFALVAFSGTSRIVVQPTEIKDEDHKKELFQIIEDLQPSQGTYMGDALHNVYEIIKAKQSQYAEKQVMLISDGLDYTGDTDYKPRTEASKLYGELNTPTSTINVSPNNEDSVGTLQQLITYGRGQYYEVANLADLDKLMLEEVAPDITDTEIKVSSPVHVVKAKDEVLKNIQTEGELAFGNIDYYVNSQIKMSASTVLTVDYARPSGSVVQSPLYAHWNYGNGKVITFTGRISGTESQNFLQNNGSALISNAVGVNVPETRVDYPYALNINYDGLKLNVEVVPVAIDPNAKMEITMTSPSGEIETQELHFTTSNFYGSFDCENVGKYTIDLNYTYNNQTTTTQTYYNLAYSKEYDSFTAYDSSVLYSSVRNMGRVTEDGTVSLENEANEVETYEIDGALPLMILTVVLYVIDIAVRKLKKEDILSLFAKKANRKEGK